MKDDCKQYKNKIITIPNLLSFIRLCLIPFIVWLYCFEDNYFWTLILLLISGATDIIDGIIARCFKMVSDLGKALDPIADKLTQMAMLLCLVSRFRYMLVPFVVLVTKEIISGTINLLTIKKTHIVLGAVWHGKLTTVLLYSLVVIHLIWYKIPLYVSNILILVCTVMMLISAVLYTCRNIKVLTEKKEMTT